MHFHLIDRETWGREEYFAHYFSAVPCAYSMTVRLDITAVKASGRKLYPVMLHCLTTLVNRHSEFRTALDGAGRLGVYDAMLPCYTIFHPDTETFSNLWTEYSPDLDAFCRAYEEDLSAYGGIHRFCAKPDPPENCFTVSIMPWAAFEGFHLHLPKGNAYLLPIFTMGKYVEENGRWLLPLAIQVHHAVCDGFHACRFANELQDMVGGTNSLGQHF